MNNDTYFLVASVILIAFLTIWAFWPVDVNTVQSRITRGRN